MILNRLPSSSMMFRFASLSACCIFGLMFAGCAAGPSADLQVLTPSGFLPRPVWTQEEAAKPFVARLVRKADLTSHHIARVRVAESPHTHQRHEVTVFLLSGRVRAHVGDKHVELGPGSVVDIPAGTVHWVENLASEPSEAYVIFSPPFDGLDIVPAPAAK